LLADQEHVPQAEQIDLPYIDAEGLKKFSKQRKPMKKFFKQYKVLLASDSIIKQLPRLVGPVLSKLGKFPVAVTHSDNLQDKVNEARSTVKF
jgi:large subunit ribosomal protein L10Ae